MVGVVKRLKGSGIALFKKGLSENVSMFEFEDLIS